MTIRQNSMSAHLLAGITGLVAAMSSSCVQPGAGALGVQGVLAEQIAIDQTTNQVTCTGIQDTFKVKGVLDIANGLNRYTAQLQAFSNLPAGLQQNDIQLQRQQSPNYPNYGPTDSSPITFTELKAQFSFADAAIGSIESNALNPATGTVFNVNNQLGQTGTAAVQIDMKEAIDKVRGLLVGGERVTVIAELALQGQTAAGYTVESPPFFYPIELCSGCLIKRQADCEAIGQNLVSNVFCIEGQDVVSSFCAP